MLDSNNFLELIKRAAVDANEQAQPCDILFGTVVSEKPLRIRVEQKMELGEAQLILTRNVSDHKVKFDGENVRSFSEDAEGSEIVIKNALKSGEQVVLVKQRGGQKFLVLDRRAEI